ncbi:hypothetical protein LL965_21720, partial [Xanthomonas cassavae CFBP 4642]
MGATLAMQASNSWRAIQRAPSVERARHEDSGISPPKGWSDQRSRKTKHATSAALRALKPPV